MPGGPHAGATGDGRRRARAQAVGHPVMMSRDSVSNELTVTILKVYYYWFK